MNDIELYIKNQLVGFNQKFIDAVIDVYKFMQSNKECGTCLTISVQLVVIAKYYGYNAQLVYGLCKYDGHDFYHAWIEINGKIIDIAIYGNVNWSGIGCKIDLPVVYCDYDTTDVYYGKFEFDETWFDSDLYEAEGWTIEKYLNNSKHQFLWYLLFNRIGSKQTSYEDWEHIMSFTRGIYIEVPLEYGYLRDKLSSPAFYEVSLIDDKGNMTNRMVVGSYDNAIKIRNDLLCYNFDVIVKQIRMYDADLI